MTAVFACFSVASRCVPELGPLPKARLNLTDNVGFGKLTAKKKKKVCVLAVRGNITSTVERSKETSFTSGQ